MQVKAPKIPSPPRALAINQSSMNKQTREIARDLESEPATQEACAAAYTEDAGEPW